MHQITIKMTDTIELEAIHIDIDVDMESVQIKENIKNLMKDFCESRIIFLLEEKDTEQHILRKIRGEEWENDSIRDHWVDNDLNYYLALENESIRINGIRLQSTSLQDWNTKKYHELMCEITQRQYWRTLFDMADDYWICIWKDWRDVIEEDMNDFCMALLAEYNRLLICNKSVEELLDYLNMLCPMVSPK